MKKLFLSSGLAAAFAPLAGLIERDGGRITDIDEPRPKPKDHASRASSARAAAKRKQPARWGKKRQVMLRSGRVRAELPDPMTRQVARRMARKGW